MTIIIPPELERRIARAIAFRNWSDGTKQKASVEQYIINQMDSVLESIEEDMVVDSEGCFIADRLWECEV